MFICSCFNLLLDMIFDMIYGIYIYIVNLIYVMDLLVEKKALISCYYFILLIIWLCPIIAAIGGSDKECVVPEHKGHKCFWCGYAVWLQRKLPMPGDSAAEHRPASWRRWYRGQGFMQQYCPIVLQRICYPSLHIAIHREQGN